VALTYAPAQLTELLTEAVDALRPVAGAKGVSLTLDLGGGTDLTLSCDATRLQQVVTNLLGNSIKFTPAGGQVEVQLAVQGHDAQLTVRDTGQGIPAEFLPAVFERFRQADGSMSRRHGGLGLGLSIAKQIVEMHGGTITAHSEGAERGAVFTVTLPLRPATAAPETSTADGPAPLTLTGLRVLVVDDEADARELLRRLLLEQGCDVTCAASADEAMQALTASARDVLLTDIGMPGTDGYELLRRARACDTQLIAIAVTAFARPEDRDRALAAGFNGHLAKPVTPAQMLQMVARAVVAARQPADVPAGAGR
jgi:CheY-like chemotaxis protein